MATCHFAPVKIIITIFSSIVEENEIAQCRDTVPRHIVAHPVYETWST